MIRLLLIPLLLLVATTSLLFGQTYTMVNGGAINACNGALYDDGGPAGDYGDNLQLITTICANGSGGTHIRLSFSGVLLEPGDELCFYDGSDINAPLLACASDYLPGEPFIVQATAVNPGGCLTVTFDSDASGHAAGFAAVISCVASCQQVLSKLVSTDPVAVPLDTGWMDICPRERIFLTGQGLYPQNGFKYNQSDLTTVFEWNYGDGSISYGPNASHRYDQPGGYYVQLFLTDVQGCRSTNLLNQRVRVAPRPNFDPTGVLDPSICAGDTIRLGATVNTVAGSTLSVTPHGASFSVEGSRSDSLAIPDGTGIAYETSLYFTEFSPGQVLISGSDLESVCVNMEHSWIRDLEIKLTCPNGQSAILHNFGGQTGSQVFLGEPNDNDGFNPIPGSGYDYCWKGTASNPSWLQYANTVLGGNGTLPAGDYRPYQSFNNFVGCPLNGEWVFTAIDDWQADNGYLFAWGIKFKDFLYPNVETFTPQLTTWSWNNHPSIFFATLDSIAASPQNAGTAGYTFTVQDNFGCAWDTLVSVAVLPFTHPDCIRCTEDYQPLADTAVCAGSPIQLAATSLQPTTLEILFEAYPDYRLGFANHPPVKPFAAPIAVNSLDYPFLGVPIVQITSICMDLETDFAGDLQIFVRSPDGKQLELSTGNGGAGKNYKVTCFTPTATVPIQGSAAPFNGTYKPEGNWADLTNAVVNGDWKLIVSDGFGPNQFGRVKWWSIGFNFVNTVNYTWNNATSLSCAGCPDPTANPSATTSYAVIATDKLGCQHRDTATVTIQTFFPAPTNLQVINVGVSTLTMDWQPVPGALGYEVRVNGGAWQVPSGNLSHQVTGLSPGDAVYFDVRALGGGLNCLPAISSDTVPFVVCTLDAILNSTTPVACYGTSTGSAYVSVSNVNPPVLYFPDGLGPAHPNGDLVDVFSAGLHFVVVSDQTGCRDTVFFLLTQPDSLALSVSVLDAVCNGDNSGQATAVVTGGTGPIDYQWQGCPGGPVINMATATGLLAGCYAVTVTDANGCTAIDSVLVSEPPGFQFVSSQNPVSCFGGTDGSATVSVSGSTPPYTYLWGNGQMTDTATGLAAGFHIVTVTDAAGCQAATFIQVFEPALLTIDSTATHPISCFGGDNGTATVFATGGTPTYQYLWSDMQTGQKAVGLAAGSYSVTVSDLNGCTVETNVTVGTPTALVVSFDSIRAEICAGDCLGMARVVATGGVQPYNYSWDNPLIAPEDSMPTALCPGAYTVTVQDARGCTQSNTVDIAAAVPLDVQYGPAAPTCAGQADGVITTSVGGGSSPYTFLWSHGSTDPSPVDLPCGDYSVTLTDAAGCAQVAMVQVDCPALLQIIGLVSQAVNCFGQTNGSLLVQTAGGTGAFTSLWNDPNAQNDSLAQNLAPGAYIVTVTDVQGCTATGVGTVLEPALLTVDLLPTSVSCFGDDDGRVSAVVNGGSLPYQYQWNTLSADSVLPDVPAGTYSVTVQDINGCTTTASGNVDQPTTPVVVTATQTRRACYGISDNEALATAMGNNGPPYIFTWSDGQTGPQATNLPNGSITVTATDVKGCYSSQVLDVQQFDSIKLNVISAQPLCYGGQNGIAGVNSIAGGAGMGDTSQYNYQWSVPGTPNSILLTGLAGGQTYSITATDFQGCTGDFTFYIPETPEIMLDITVQDVRCFGQNNGSVIISPEPFVLYVWDNNTSGPQITNLAAGSYQVTATDADKCTTVKTIVVQQSQPITVNFTATKLVCSSDSNGTIMAAVLGGVPAYTLQWNTGATTPDLTNLGPGNYVLMVSDSNGCTASDSVRILLPDSLMIQVQETAPRCYGAENGRVQLAVTGGTVPYRYSLNGATFGGSSTFTGLRAGNYTVQVRDGRGCITTITVSLTDPPPVTVVLDLDTTIVLGQAVTLSPTVNNAFGLTSSSWRSALLENISCLDTPACAEILVQPLFTNTYFVTVTDAQGCTGRASQRVSVEKPRGVYVPTGFSPNNDQENDRLLVHGKSLQVRNIRLFRVYDRWGELVFEDRDFNVNDPARGWDGQWRGQDSAAGVYVWYLEAVYPDGYEEALQGEVMLIR